MNTATPAPGAGTGLLPLLGGILRSEARKLHTVRSTWWILLAGFTFTVYLVFQAFLPAADPMRSTLGAPGVARAVAGAGLYLTVLALLGFGLGAALRSAAAAVAALFGLLFVPTLLAALLPQAWQDRIAGYLPMNAGDAIYTTRPEAHMLAPWTGLAVFAAYAVIALAPGFTLITRRDA